MKKRKAGLPVVVETGTTSVGHEAQPSTATGLNHHHAVGEVKVDLVGDN